MPVRSRSRASIAAMRSAPARGDVAQLVELGRDAGVDVAAVLGDGGRVGAQHAAELRRRARRPSRRRATAGSRPRRPSRRSRRRRASASARAQRRQARQRASQHRQVARRRHAEARAPDQPFDVGDLAEHACGRRRARRGRATSRSTASWRRRMARHVDRRKQQPAAQQPPAHRGAASRRARRSASPRAGDEQRFGQLEVAARLLVDDQRVGRARRRSSRVIGSSTPGWVAPA